MTLCQGFTNIWKAPPLVFLSDFGWHLQGRIWVFLPNLQVSLLCDKFLHCVGEVVQLFWTADQTQRRLYKVHKFIHRFPSQQISAIKVIFSKMESSCFCQIQKKIKTRLPLLLRIFQRWCSATFFFSGPEQNFPKPNFVLHIFNQQMFFLRQSWHLLCIFWFMERK